MGLVSTDIEGLLIVGSNPFTVELAERLKELKIETIIVDQNWYHLRLAKQVGIPVHYGEVLSEDSEFKLELNRFGSVLAATDNPSYNALVGGRFAHEYGHEHIYRLAVEAQLDDTSKMSNATSQVPAILDGMLHDEAVANIRMGWKIKAVLVNEQHPYTLYKEKNPEIVPLISLTASKLLIHTAGNIEPKESGYTLLVFSPPAA